MKRQLDYITADATAVVEPVSPPLPPQILPAQQQQQFKIPQPPLVPLPQIPSSPIMGFPVQTIQDSPRTLLKRPIFEVKDGTPKKQKQCNCKHSRCLKLILLQEDNGEVPFMGKHNKGCHCKKSGCLKKYCECFQANVLCSENCKCIGCKNNEGSEERKSLSHLASLDLTANAALSCTTSGFPSVYKKTKTPEMLFSVKDSTIASISNFMQMKATGTSAPVVHPVPSSQLDSVNHPVHSAEVALSKFTYRSLLADVVQEEDIQDLCKLLVVVSSEVARTFTDMYHQEMKPVREQQTGSSPTSRKQENINDLNEIDSKRVREEDYSTGNDAEKSCTEDVASDYTDVQGIQKDERPLSPGTLSLMCDEQDYMLTPSEHMSTCSMFPPKQNISKVYAEQERHVLTLVRDSLQKIVSCGKMKEAKFSSMAMQLGTSNNISTIATAQEVHRQNLQMHLIL